MKNVCRIGGVLGHSVDNMPERVDTMPEQVGSSSHD
jgi:hypothetical protein